MAAWDGRNELGYSDNSSKISKSIKLINLFEKFFFLSELGTIYEINEIARLIYSKAGFR